MLNHGVFDRYVSLQSVRLWLWADSHGMGWPYENSKYGAFGHRRFFPLFGGGQCSNMSFSSEILRVQIGRFTYVVLGVGSNRFWSRKRWCFETIPIGSIVLVYNMLTWLGYIRYIDGIHVTIYIAAPWILWDGNTMQPVMKATEVMGGRLKVRFFPLTPRKGDFVPWLQGWHYPKRRLYVKTIDSLFMFIIYYIYT